MRTCIALSALITSSVALSQPQLRQYSAAIEQSSWLLSKNSPVECQLQHEIPQFGQAVFRSVASKGLNLDFELQMLRLPDNYAVAEVLSEKPKNATLFKRFGIEDQFITAIGSVEYIKKKLGLDAEHLGQKILQLL